MKTIIVMHFLHGDKLKIYIKLNLVIQILFFQIAADNDFVPRKLVEEYISLCTIFTLKRARKVVAPLQPILTSNFMERLQV